MNGVPCRRMKFPADRWTVPGLVWGCDQSAEQIRRCCCCCADYKCLLDGSQREVKLWMDNGARLSYKEQVSYSCWTYKWCSISPRRIVGIRMSLAREPGACEELYIVVSATGRHFRPVSRYERRGYLQHIQDTIRAYAVQEADAFHYDGNFAGPSVWRTARVTWKLRGLVLVWWDIYLQLVVCT